MKNLKKVLALVLVVCMAFSLVTFASAATPKVQDYKDASSIKQTEAVDLFTALGILNGTDGSFNPTANVTREQAAKIICYMLLGATGADGLKANSTAFSDVAPTRWSAGAIQYCVVKGIINGNGDGTFNPEGNVTASQFAKMLLTAIGYGKMGEYTGADWEINTIATATRLGILSLSLNYSQAATREQVAQYAFNAYTGDDCYSVSYSKDISDYKTLGLGNLAYQQYVTKTTPTPVNGINMYQWMKKSVILNNNRYSDEDQKVLGTSNAGTALVNLTTVGKSGFIAELESSGVQYFLNGTEKTGSALTTFINNKLNKDLNFLNMGYVSERGMSISLVDTDNDGLANKVLCIEKSVVVLAADAAVSTTSGTVTIPGVCTNVAKTLIDGTYSDMKKDDVVLYYVDATGIYHVQKAKSVTGKLTSGSSSMITFAGNLYFQSGLVGVAQDDSATTSVNESLFGQYVATSSNFGADATIWLDDSGAVVNYELAAAAAKDFAVLVGYEYKGVTGEAGAKIAKADGTVVSYTVAADASGSVPDQSDVFDFSVTTTSHGYLVSYKINESGKITITKVTGSDTVDTAYAAKTSVLTADTANRSYYISSTTSVFYFNTALPYNKDTNPVSVTTGYSNTVAANPGDGYFYGTTTTSGNVLNAVMFRKTASISSSSNYAYVVHFALSAPTASYSGDTVTWTYNVYVNGAPTQLKSTYSNLFQNAGLYMYTLGANGYVMTAQRTNDATGTGTRIAILNNGNGLDVTNLDSSYVAMGNITYLTNSSTKFYLVDPTFPTGTVSVGTLGKSSSTTVASGNVHYYVTYVQVNKDNVNTADAIYFTYTVD